MLKIEGDFWMQLLGITNNIQHLEGESREVPPRVQPCGIEFLLNDAFFAIETASGDGLQPCHVINPDLLDPFPQQAVWKG